MKKEELQKFKIKRSLYSMLLKVSTYATLDVNSGLATLESDGTPKMIEITYTGQIYIYNRLPEGFYISNDGRRIRIINILGKKLNKENILFNYMGIFNPVSFYIYSFQNLSIKGKINNSDRLNQIDQTPTNLEDDTTIITDYDSYLSFTPPSKAVLGKNIDDDTIKGLYSRKKLINGYSGYYNFSPSEEIFMTNKRRTSSSKPILNKTLQKSRLSKRANLQKLSRNISKRLNNLKLNSNKDITQQIQPETKIKSISKSLKNKIKGGKY